jgi:hypothetical protein
MPARKKTPPSTELDVLTRTARRCALCFGLEGDLSRKKGQIAHIDHDPSNTDPGNLVFLCLDHHDEYDSTTRFAKGVTELELKAYQSVLVVAIAKGLHHSHPPAEPVPTDQSLANAEDKQLLERFLADYPSNGFLRSLAQGTFANPFSRNRRDELNTALAKWSGAEYTFHNAELDRAKERLLDALDAFAWHIAKDSFYIDEELAGVPSEWADTFPERYESTISELDKAARDTFAQHQKFIRLARKRLV